MLIPPAISRDKGVLVTPNFISKAITTFSFESNKLLAGGLSFKTRTIIANGYDVKFNVYRNNISNFTYGTIHIKYAPIITDEAIHLEGEFITFSSNKLTSLAGQIDHRCPIGWESRLKILQLPHYHKSTELPDDDRYQYS